MTGGKRDVWQRIWAAIEDGDEPTDSIPGDLAETNQRLAELTERIGPQLERTDLECLSGVSLVLAAFELALTGEAVGGRDTFLALAFTPRRKNRVRRRERERSLAEAWRRRAELLEKGGLKARDADARAASASGVNRTDMKDWGARLEGLFNALDHRSSED